MKITTLILTFLCFISFNLKAQTNEKFDTTAIEKSLIGKWIFVEAVDKDNKKVDYFIQDYKGPDGKEIKIVASGPDVTINKDYSYVKKFTEVNSDNGTWKLISENEIEFEMLILKDSRQGNMIIQTQEMLGKEWRTDANGNFLDASTDKILSIDKDRMTIEYKDKYILIYKRN
jgi:hypothetical protein